MHTTPEQRRLFYQRHLRGETYADIADGTGVSLWCVRYWCRKQRDGGSHRTVYQRSPAGLLARFHPRIRYGILRLRLEHPRWGPDRIRARLLKRRSLRALKVPSAASIGRYLHQWPRFRRPLRRGTPPAQRPHAPTRVLQRVQIDFKMGIPLQDGTLVNLHTVRDPVGEACLAACIFPAGRVGRAPKPVTAQQARAVLRIAFARWHTLVDEVQTDSESALVPRIQEAFPSRFTLWLAGLGITHLVIRRGRPTDNAEVERCHRTITDYAVVGNEAADVAQLQQILDQAVDELAFELGSRAEGCQGQPPVQAHPELLQPRRPFEADHELALFDLRRVDAYLTGRTWERQVGKTGQTEIGGNRYSVGCAHARRPVLVRFDPTDRHFVFHDAEDPAKELCRRPARGLEVADLTGLPDWPEGPGPQQLPLLFSIPEGVTFQ